jgi:hypothetical protein
MSIIGTLDVNAYGTTYPNISLQGVGEYQDGTTVVRAYTNEGEAFATLTVCVPGVKLNSKEVLIKTWSENEPLARAAAQSGLFEDTGRRVQTGYTQAQVWRIK